MLLSRKLFALSSLLLSLVCLYPHDLLAVDEEAPIIALANNNIYAVSPVDGDARVLVERDPVKDTALNAAHIGPRISLISLSPDSTKFIYSAPLYEVLDPVFEPKRDKIATIRPEELILVDIETGEQTLITNQAASLAEAVEKDSLTVYSDPTWSIDGERLYFFSIVRPMHRNRVQRKALEYYDVITGERGVIAKISSETSIRGLYSLPQGVLLVSGIQNRAEFTYTLYMDDGTILNTGDMTILDTMDCTNGPVFSMNPMLHDYNYSFGYYSFEETQPLATLLDVSTGNSTVMEPETYVGLVSQANPHESLRLLFTQACYYNEFSDRWVATDAEGHYIESMAFPGVESVYELAISPDGQSIARLQPTGDYLEPDPIIVMDVNGEHELDFKANKIMWGATAFTFDRAIYRG